MHFQLTALHIITGGKKYNFLKKAKIHSEIFLRTYIKDFVSYLLTIAQLG